MPELLSVGVVGTIDPEQAFTRLKIKRRYAPVPAAGHIQRFVVGRDGQAHKRRVQHPFTRILVVGNEEDLRRAGVFHVEDG